MIKLYNLLFEDHRHGNAHGHFLLDEPDKKEELLLKLGIPQNKLSEYLEELDSLISSDKTPDEKARKQTTNQIFAVIDGRKPMWFGSPTDISDLGRIGTLVSNNLSKLGLSSYVKGDEIVVGKPQNVEQIKPEIDRVTATGEYLADKDFHRAMGLALGYPAEDVETFVKTF